jgi:hypothetical protein
MRRDPGSTVTGTPSQNRTRGGGLTSANGASCVKVNAQGAGIIILPPDWCKALMGNSSGQSSLVVPMILAESSRLIEVKRV